MRLEVSHKLKILVYKYAFTPSVQVGRICLKSMQVMASNSAYKVTKNAIHKAQNNHDSHFSDYHDIDTNILS